MTRTVKILGYLIVVSAGIFGCTKGPGSASPSGSNSAGAEAKAQRLEEDYKAAAAARDALRQKLAAAEDQQSRLQKQLDQSKAEGESLRADIRARMSERDEVKGQYEAFRRMIKDALGQAETGALSPVPNPNTTVSSAPIPMSQN